MTSRVASAWLVVLLLPAAPAFAERLPTTVVPEHYDLTFDVDIPHASFRGTERIRVQIGEPTAKVVLHALELQIQTATIGAGAGVQTATVTLDAAAQTATLTVPKPL